MESIVVTVFVLVYLGMIFGGLPFLQLDRTGIALLGAIILVASQAMSVDEAYRSLHPPTLIILFAFMSILVKSAKNSRDDTASHSRAKTTTDSHFKTAIISHSKSAILGVGVRGITKMGFTKKQAWARIGEAERARRQASEAERGRYDVKSQGTRGFLN